jgi:recombination protein RecA
MAHPAVAVLESALRARKLDRTLTTALPPLAWADPSSVLPMDIPRVDGCLRGGMPRGQLSELTGACSSGRMTLLLQLMAAAMRRGEIAALVDTHDRLDVASAASAGVDLDRLLWIRGLGTGGPIEQDPPSRTGREIGDLHCSSLVLGGSGKSHADKTAGLSQDGRGRNHRHKRVPRVRLETAIDRALKALNLVLQAGGFGVVALDLADASAVALRQIPFTTWPRLQRVIEGSDTACVLVTPEPLARSAGGLTLSLAGRSTWTGVPGRSRRLQGFDLRLRVVSPRKRIDGDVSLRTTVTA